MKGKMWKLAVCACAAALCFALAACGGSSASSSAASSASAAASSSAAAQANPAEKFVGEWKYAAAEMEGLTVTGDLSALLGEELDITLTLEDDNTGAMAFNDEAADIVWDMDGDDAITIKAADSDGDFDGATATVEDGVLTLAMDDDEFSGNVYLTADGTMEGVFEIDADDADAVTSEKDIIGSWRLTGINMMGVSMYGSADDLAAMVGEDDEDYIKLEINSDGTAAIMGQDATWEVGSEGAIIDLEGVEIPLKMLNGDLVFDFGEVADDYGFDMVMLYTK